MFLIKKLKGGKSGLKVFKFFNRLYKEKKNFNPIVNRVLNYLEQKNINFVPKFLKETKRYNVYTYTEGLTQPIVSMDVNQIFKIIDMVKEIQKVSKDFTNSDLVICHGDLSQMNVVFDNKNLPKFIIDWDGVYLGNWLDDICYILILWVNIGSLSENNEKLIEKLQKSIDYCNFDENTKNILKDKMIERAKFSLINISNKSIYKKTESWVIYVIQWIENNWHKLNL